MLEAASTVHSILRGVADGNAHLQRYYTQRFAEQYSEPLVEYLCRLKRQTPEEARDLVQQFWLEKLIEPDFDKNLIAKFLAKQPNQRDQASSFRAYLCRSISNFLLDSLRRRRPHASIEQLEMVEDNAEHSLLEIANFDSAWANRVMHQVVCEVRSECERSGQDDMWELFLLQILIPSIEGCQPPGYASLAKHFGYNSAKQASNAVTTVIRKFQRSLRNRIADYLPVSAEAKQSTIQDEEMAAILQILSAPGALDLGLFAEFLEPIRNVSNDSIIFSIAPGAPVSNRNRWNLDLASLYQSNEDLEAFWKHFLNASIHDWLEQSDQAAAAGKPEPWKIADLIGDEPIPQDILVKVRNQAKHVHQTESEEPSIVLALVYLLAIIHGIEQHAVVLSSDPISKIAQRSERFLQMPWIDTKTSSKLTSFVNQSN